MSALRDKIADALIGNQSLGLNATPQMTKVWGTPDALADAVLPVIDAWLADMLSPESPPEQMALAEALLAHYPQPGGHDDHSCLVIHDDPRTPATVVIAALRSLAGGAS